MGGAVRRRPPVIADVARAAGVSVPTVSRVLSGSTPVSDTKRDLVLAAVRDLGYRPDSAARALVTGRRSLISVLTSNTTRYGYATTLQGIEEAARAAGHAVAITVVDPADDASDPTAAARAAVELALAQPVAGVLVLEFDAHGTRVLGVLPATVPVAAVSSSAVHREGIPQALFDDHRGGVDATRYLLGLGHRTVHHVSVPGSGLPSGRTAGWRATLLAAGVEPPDVVEADWSAASGYAAGTLLARTAGVTAVLCGNDEIAFGVVKALQEQGLDVPEDVSVVGFDDHPLAGLWTPRLTTMAQDFAELGRTAVGYLLGTADPDEGARTTAPDHAALHLVVRESTAPPPRP